MCVRDRPGSSYPRPRYRAQRHGERGALHRLWQGCATHDTPHVGSSANT